MPRRATFDLKEFAELWCRGVSYVEIRDRLGCTKSVAYQAAFRHGFPRRYPDGLFAPIPNAVEKASAVKNLLKAGADPEAIAYGFGCDVADLEGYLAAVRPERPQGEGAPAAPLSGRPCWTPDRDAALAAVVRDGGGYSELARLADAWGLRMVDVQTRYHRVRAGA